MLLHLTPDEVCNGGEAFVQPLLTEMTVTQTEWRKFRQGILDEKLKSAYASVDSKFQF